MLLIACLIAAGKVSGLMKDILLTYFQGASQVTDAFFLSSAVSGVLNAALLAAIPIAVVPLYTDFRRLGGENSALLKSSLISVVAIAALISLIAAVFGRAVVSFISDAPSETSSLAANYLSVMAVGFCFSSFVTISNSIQVVEGRVVPSYLVPIANNVFFCVAVIIVGIELDFLWVVASGVMSWMLLFAINAGVLVRLLRVLRGARATKGHITSSAALLFPALVAIYAEQLTLQVGTYLASGLPGHSITLWAYAGKLSALITSVFLVFLTAYLFPRIATLVGQDDPLALTDYLVRLVRLGLISVTPALAYMILASDDVVRVVFQRGLFSISDADVVSSLLEVVLLAVPFLLIRDVLNRVYFAMHRHSVPYRVLGACLVLNLAVGVILIEFIGLKGVAVALVLSSVANAALLIYLLGPGHRSSIAHAVFRAGGSSAVAAASAAFVALRFQDALGLPFVSVLPYVVIYAAILWLVGVPEVRGQTARLLIAFQRLIR